MADSDHFGERLNRHRRQGTEAGAQGAREWAHAQDVREGACDHLRPEREGERSSRSDVSDRVAVPRQRAPIGLKIDRGPRCRKGAHAANSHLAPPRGMGLGQNLVTWSYRAYPVDAHSRNQESWLPPLRT